MRFAFALLLPACGNGAQPTDASPDADTDTDTDADTDTDTDSGSDSDSDSGSDTGTDTETSTDTGSDTDTDTGLCAPEDGDPPAVVIGAGRAEYAEVACEGILEIFEGPQGCCHFYGAVKEAGIALEPFTTIGWQVVTDGGETVTEFGDVELLVGPDAWVDLAGGWKANLDHMVIMTLDEPADVTEQALDVTMRLTTSEGTVYLDTARIRVFFDG